MKNYNEYEAPEGYYYHQGDLYAKGIILPLSQSIEEYELVTEEVYQEYLKQEELKRQEEEKAREQERELPQE